MGICSSSLNRLLLCRPATKQNLGEHAAKICVPSIVDAVELGSDSSTSSYFFASVQRASEKSETAKPASGVGRLVYRTRTLETSNLAMEKMSASLY